MVFNNSKRTCGRISNTTELTCNGVRQSHDAAKYGGQVRYDSSQNPDPEEGHPESEPTTPYWWGRYESK